MKKQQHASMLFFVVFCRVIAEMILDKVLSVVLVINLVKFLLCAFTCSYFDLYLLIGNKRMQKFLSPILLHGLCTVLMYFSYILDVLWGKPIKLIQVASTSELYENQRNDLLFFEIVPCHCCGASEA